MKKVKWLIEERELPGYGLMKPDQVYTLPKKLAESLAIQGHVELVKKTKKSKEV